MIDRKEIDLLIRASVQNKQDLKSIPKTIKELEDALDKQTAAAKRGEASIDQLKATLLSLEQAQSALTSNAGLISAFQKMGDAIKVQEERTKKAAQAYDQFKVKLDGLGVTTEKQQDRFIKLSAASERSVATLAKQQANYVELAGALNKAGIETNNLADAERQIRESAAQLGVVMVKNRDAIASYSDTVQKARTADKQRAAEVRANAQAQVEAQARLVQQQDALLASSNRLAIQQAAAKEAFGRDNALISQADAADRAARGYTSLARAASDLSPKVLGVRDAINAILNPTATADKSLDGLVASITKVGDSVSKIKGPVDGYRTSMAQLEAAQKNIVTQSGLIENFRKQTEALRQNRTELVAARADVAKYADAVRQGGDSGARFSQSLATAQTRLQGAAQAMAAQIQATRGVRDQLAAAGISTTQLADAETRLVNAARASTAAMGGLTTAVGQYGVASEKAAKNGFGSGDGERTTLNFAQRLRGQILSLTAAYVGLFGAIQQAKGAIDAISAQQSIENRIGVAIDSNDSQKIGKEFEYLKGRADFYGTGLKGLADAYASYAVASKSAGITGNTQKFIFEQISASMRVMNLNTEASGRAWQQFNQILQKPKPEIEDLNTIAESGFIGARGLMARGLREIGVAGIKAGTEVQDMSAMMKKGLISSQDAIYALAVQAQKEFGGRIPQATQTLTAELGRFETAWFEFQKAVADASWAETFKKVLIDLQTLMKSEDGMKAAKALGEAFAALGNGLILVLKNLETVKTLSEAFIALWAVAKFGEAVTGLGNLAKGVDGVGKQITTTQGVFMGFQALVAGWALGTILQEKIPAVKTFGQLLTDTLEEYWARIKFGFLVVVDTLPIFFGNAMKATVNAASGPIRLLTKQFAGLATALGADGVAGSLNASIESITLQYEDAGKIISQRKSQLAADLAAIKKNRDGLIELSKRQGVKLATGGPDAPTASGGRPTSTLPTDDKKAEAAARKREAQIEAITKSLEDLSVKTDKAQSDSLSAQLGAVDTQYDQLKRRIEKLGGTEGANFAKQFAEGIASLKGQITDKFNKKLMDEQESLTKKLEDVDAAGGRRSKDSLDARLDAVTKKYAQTYRDIADLRKKLVDNNQDPAVADQMKARLDAGVLEIQNLEQQKFFKDQLTDQEKQVNDIIQARTAMIKTQKDLEEGGLQSNATTRENIKGIIEQTQPSLDALAATGIAFANSIQGAFDPAKLQEFIAKMQLATVSGKALNKEFEITGKQINDQIAQQGTKAFGTISDAIGKAVNGQITWKDALKETGKAAVQLFADLLKWYAEAILKQQILNTVQNAGGGTGGIGGFLSGLFSSGVSHAGGVVGGVNNRTRSVWPGMFANAPRMHSGGVAGLAPDEFATILQKNEEVVTANDPRNVLNGGLQAQGGGDSGSPVSFVLVDDQRRAAEAMATAAGGRVIMQQVRANLPTIRSWMKGK